MACAEWQCTSSKPEAYVLLCTCHLAFGTLCHGMGKSRSVCWKTRHQRANWNHPRLTKPQLPQVYGRLVQQASKFMDSWATAHGGCLESLRFGVIVYIAKSAISCNKYKAIEKINTFERFMSGRWTDSKHWTLEDMTLTQKDLRYTEKEGMLSS